MVWLYLSCTLRLSYILGKIVSDGTKTWLMAIDIKKYSGGLRIWHQKILFKAKTVRRVLHKIGLNWVDDSTW